MTKAENARAQRAWHKAHPGKNAEYLKRSRLKRKLNGKCQFCGSDKPLEGHACEECKFKKNNANRILLGMSPLKRREYASKSRRQVDLQNLYVFALRAQGALPTSALVPLGHPDLHKSALQALVKEGSVKLSRDKKTVNLIIPQ